MLLFVRDLVQRPTRHREVRCTIHHNGLRFCVETQNRHLAIEHVGWTELDGIVESDERRLEAAYNRCLARAENARG